jgi:uncharacterized protein
MGMNRTFKAAVAALTFAVGFAGSVVAGPFDDVDAAFKKGDYATAVRLLRPLAEQGDAGAQYFLGASYATGRGVTQDYAAAASWYRKAAEQGDEIAQVHLGIMHDLGQGVRQDYVAAVSWYRKAAEQGNETAQAKLALMYAQGHGVSQDYVTAHMWFNLSAASGDKDAVKGLDLAAAHLTPAQIAEAQTLAREWKPKSSP